ncbi:MAG TPA: flagellar basal body P-ring formation chaperone FlgA [Xanthobacteraceae bacterium]|nr:flagellar basal body P-ring formation chaperone FlgA [Xanthobacteraceae bacterium]
MIRIAIALSLLIALGGEAGADQTAPRLKELVSVGSEVVRIGDLVEGAGDAADIPVFRAPDLGQTGSVPVERVMDALRPHGVGNLNTGGLAEVVVTRLSRTITNGDITERIARALAGQYGFGEARNLSIMLDRPIRALHVESTATADLAVAHLYVDPRTGRFDVTFELPGSAVARRMRLRFTGNAAETVEAATLTRSLKPGEVIKASDIVMERRPKSEVGGEALGAEQAVGMAARQPLRGGQALRRADLMRPQVIQRNEAVTLVYEVPGIVLRVRGKALEAGAVGDIIGILNIQSNRTIQAVVTGPGAVSVAPVTPIITASAPDADAAPPRIQ